nr:YihY/virulence factor BrkB family protein [Lachnospiraceae bacterium]
MRTKLIRVIREYMSMVQKYHISAYASSVAFFTYLSLMPVLIVFFSLLPYTPLTEAKFMEILVRILPEYLAPAAVSMVARMYDNSGAVLSITLIVLIWSGAKGMLAFLRGLNVINHVEEKRNYVFLRLRACVYTILLLVMVIVVLVLVVFGDWIVRILTGVFPQIHYLFDALFAIRPLFMPVILTLFFGAAFTWLPNADKKYFRFELPGAFLSSILWYVSSWLFSFYVNRFFAYDVYGSLATVTIIMLWLYLCFYIVLAGALLNRFLLPANEYLHEVMKKRRKNNKA